MAGIKNSTLCAKNADYTQSDGPNANSSENNGLVTDGKMWIGSTALNVGGTHINVGSLTSPNSSVTIGYSTPNITLQVNSATVGQTITGNTGGALSPVSGNWNIFGAATASGTTPVATAGSGNTLTLNVQRSQAIASTNVNNIGLAAFNSAEFSVDSNGFVSLIAGGFTWVDATNATQALAVQTGYVTDRGGGVAYTLPATAILGSIIKIVGKLGIAVITPNANQQILIGSVSGTVGATGTATANNVGDCLELICITAGASTVWRADSVVGTWTLA